MSMILNPYRYAGAGGPTFGNASRDFEASENDFISITTGSGNGVGALVGAGNGVTVSAWVKVESFYTWQMILADVSSGGTGLSFILSVESNQKVRVLGTTSSSGVIDFQSSGTVSSSVWTHIAGVYYFDSSLSAFVNGVETPGPAASGNLLNGFGILIGRLGDYNVGYRFDGLIADVRIYNRGLSSSEISDLISGTDVSSGLVGWWLTDSDDVLDYSGNGNDGTNYGSTYSTDGPFD